MKPHLHRPHRFQYFSFSAFQLFSIILLNGPLKQSESCNKENLRREIVETILPYVDALQLTAALSEDVTLFEDSSFTKSDFAYGRYADTATHAETILNLVDVHLNEKLPDYGFTEEDVGALRTAVAEYRETLGATRARIAERTVATAEILRLMEEIDEHLANKLDKAAGAYFRHSAPEFFAGYQAAREIIG